MLLNIFCPRLMLTFQIYRCFWFVFFDGDKCFLCLDLLVFYYMFSTFVICEKTFQRDSLILLNVHLFFPSICMVSSLTLKCLILLECIILYFIQMYYIYNILYTFFQWPEYFKYFFVSHIFFPISFENSSKETL